MRFLAVVCALAVLCGAVFAAEESTEPMVKIKSEVLSKNVFRGQLRNADPVAASELSLTKGMFGFDIRGVNDLTDINENAGDVSELTLDLHVSKLVYNNSKAKLVNEITVFGGFEFFSFPESSRESTLEAYVGIDSKFDKLYGIHAKTTLHYDLDEVNGFYMDTVLYRPINLPFGFKIGKQEFKTKLAPEIGLGWGSSNYNEYYWNDDSAAFTDWHAALGLLFESKNWEFGPSVTYTDLLGEEVQDSQNDSSNLIFGFMAGFKF